MPRVGLYPWALLMLNLKLEAVGGQGGSLLNGRVFQEDTQLHRSSEVEAGARLYCRDQMEAGACLYWRDQTIQLMKHILSQRNHGIVPFLG